MIINFKDEKNKRKNAYKNYDRVRKLIKEFLMDKRFNNSENDKKILNTLLLYVYERTVLQKLPLETFDGIINLDVYRDYSNNK